MVTMEGLWSMSDTPFDIRTLFVDDVIEHIGDCLETIYGDDYDIGIARDTAIALEHVVTYVDRVINCIRPDLWSRWQG